jgi:phosphate transport system permease protein
VASRARIPFRGGAGALALPRLKPTPRGGDLALYGLCALGAVVTAVTLGDIVYQLVHGGSQAMSHFGLPFLWHSQWAPNLFKFGAGTALFGTAVCAVFSLALAAPLGIAIGIYLAMIAPPPVRAVVGPLVEMLAAIPSIILGFFGLVILAPFVHKHVEPLLHNVLGFIPIFGSPQTTGLSIFTAALLLTFMILPIVASLSRDLFLTVPPELKEGAEALGATRWEVIRGVVLPTTASGVSAACILGLGRALGEAIAVLVVIGDGALIHGSVFMPGITLASRIANDITFITSPLHRSSLFYLAVILFAITATSSVIARTIARRFERRQGMAH